MDTISPVIIKRKPTVVKRKPAATPMVVKKRKQENKQKVVLIQPHSEPQKQLIKRKSDCYWKEQGWKISYLKSLFYLRKVYVGSYKTKYARFKGEIVGEDFYIFKPSAEILQGPHRACFTPVRCFISPDKYKIHFRPDPSEINSKIKSVEVTIIESFTM